MNFNSPNQCVDTDPAHKPKTRDLTFTANNGSLLSYFPSLDGHLCPVVLWDASVHPERSSVLKLTWGEYQKTLKQRCLMPKSFSPKPDSICSTVHHYEWSKQALFDFLLQVIKRGLYLCHSGKNISSRSQFCFISYMYVSSMSANAIDRWIKIDTFHSKASISVLTGNKPRSVRKHLNTSLKAQILYH